MIKTVLAEFLSDAGRRRFSWPHHNCCLFVADWIELATGIDVVTDERGKFASYLEAETEINRAGDFLDYAAARLDPYFDRIASPQCGDVGVIKAFLPIAGKMLQRPVGAICVEPGVFAFRSPGGLTVAPSPFRAAWAVINA